MLYNAYEIQRNLLASASAVATASMEFLQHPANPFAYFGGGPLLASALDVFAHAAAPRGKPAFNLDTHADRRRRCRDQRGGRSAQDLRPASPFRARGA